MSPDRRSLLFVRRKKAGDGNVFGQELNVDGSAPGAPRQITRELCCVDSPSWTRDGRAVVFLSRSGGIPRLMRVSAHGGGDHSAARSSSACRRGKHCNNAAPPAVTDTFTTNAPRAPRGDRDASGQITGFGLTLTRLAVQVQIGYEIGLLNPEIDPIIAASRVTVVNFALTNEARVLAQSSPITEF